MKKIPKKSSINVRITKEDRIMLDLKAQQKGVTTTKLVRDRIINFLKHN